MVTVTMELQVPDELAARHFEHGTRQWCEEREDWELVRCEIDGVPCCSECGRLMEYDAALRTHVCHHPD